MQSKDKKQKAYLFGPFIGEMSWELYRFAPYMIYLKKENPDFKFIVLTRQRRFDLYGQYADIMIPLRLTNDDKLTQNCFTIEGFDVSSYDTIRKYFINRYDKQFDIVDCITPSISFWRSKLKWQFPREKMCYDFLPRRKNYDIVNKIYKAQDYILIDSLEKVEGDNIIYIDDFFNEVSKKVNNIDSTIVGCLIEFIKKCSIVLCNSKSKIYIMSFLLKKSVVLIDDLSTDDEISLLNPFKVKVYKVNNLQEGLKII